MCVCDTDLPEWVDIAASEEEIERAREKGRDAAGEGEAGIRVVVEGEGEGEKEKEKEKEKEEDKEGEESKEESSFSLESVDPRTVERLCEGANKLERSEHFKDIVVATFE